MPLYVLICFDMFWLRLLLSNMSNMEVSVVMVERLSIDHSSIQVRQNPTFLSVEGDCRI